MLGDENEIQDYIEDTARSIQSVKQKKGMEETGSRGRVLIELNRDKIDIVMLGRSGVGKSTLLKAITNYDDIETSGGLDHCTKTARCYTRPIYDGKNLICTLRFWDTEGMDEWNSREVALFFAELASDDVKPMCVIYCGTANGRVPTNIVKDVMAKFAKQNVLLFYTITNIWAMNSNQRIDQINGGLEICCQLFENESLVEVKGDKWHWSIPKRIHMFCVNSEPFIDKDRDNTVLEVLNVHQLMKACATDLDCEKLLHFFLVSIKNQSYWTRLQGWAMDWSMDVKRVLQYFLVKFANPDKELENDKEKKN